MRFKLFAFDLDGTLLDDQGRVLPGVRGVLANLREEARITLATGRSLTSAWPYIVEFGIEDPVILYHGAVVFCPQRRVALRELRVPGEAAVAALRAAREFPVEAQLYRSVDEPCLFVERLTPAIAEFASKEGLEVRCVPALEPLARENPLKLLFIGDPTCMGAMKTAFENLGLTVVRSERNFLEVLPPHVSKGEALAWLCERLDIPLDQVVAVGDQESDVSMFERVGLGVAMASAPAWVREQAVRVVVTPVELKNFWSGFSTG